MFARTRDARRAANALAAALILVTVPASALASEHTQPAPVAVELPPATARPWSTVPPSPAPTVATTEPAAAPTKTAPAPSVRPTEPPSAVFADDFTGAGGSAPNGALWRLKVTDQWQPAAELQTYTTDRANAQLDGSGRLAITARADGAGGWTSARLQSLAFLHYGRIEARVKMPTGAGAWGAFWLLGDDSSVGWPACGEIDVVELPAAEGGRAYAGTHQTGADGGHVGSGSMVAPLQLADPGGWHTYAVDWRPGRLTFYTDGAVRGTITREAIEAAGGVWLFDDRPQQIILNLAVGGWGGTPGDWTEQTMLVDYVKVTR